MDTIKLMLQLGDYTIIEHDRFNPSTIGFFATPYYRLGRRGYMHCDQNPTSEELRNGIYKPRLTITRRIREGGFDVPLAIEFSLLKYHHGDNFFEVETENFNEISSRLPETLKGMGVLVRPDKLINAPVSSVHYAKNIFLTNHTTSSMILNAIRKANFSKRFDLSKSDFREGHIIRLHTNDFEIAIYDKKADLNQSKISEKRAFERDNAIQLNFFEKNEFEEPFEVLRVEIRLNSRRKIRQVLEKIGVDVEPTFIKLFSTEISQKVLLLFWQEIEQELQLTSFDIRNPFGLFEEVLRSNPSVSTGKMLKLLQVLTLVNDVGVRQFRTALPSNQEWYGLNKELKQLRIPAGIKYQVTSEVGVALKEFKTNKPSDFLLANVKQSKL